MDSIPVNWEALDGLVIDFAKSERLIEDSNNSSPQPSPPSSPSTSSPSSSSSSLSSYKSRLLIRQIRRSLEAGEIDAAVDLLRAHAPSVLDDHRLLFRLQKQKFIELLRKGTAEDRDAAINCLRTALAPCALDAYPEAYAEFKHILLAFVYDKNDQSSPVAYEWSERRRSDIAGLFSSVLRAHLHAYDPVFAMALRYLISIHKVFCFRQGVPSPISDLTDRLLLEEHDPPATPQESLYQAPPFPEVEIQALANAVELTRQGAVDSLRFARGDLFQAFQNELCRMKLDVSLLDELVHEFCIYRGIVDSTVALPSGECRNNKLSDGESSINDALMVDSPGTDTNVGSMLTTDTEERYPGETLSSHDDCSTSKTHQSSNLKVLQRSGSHAIGERKKRKRWRGRHGEQEFVSEVHTVSSVDELNAGCMDILKDDLSKVEAISKRGDKYEIMLGMKDLASRGMTAEVVEEINAIDPEFFVQNPALLFQLKRVEFLKLVSSGDHSRALRVACTYLGPLAANDPTLLKPLKETLLALLRRNEDSFGERLPLQALATSLQVAVGRRLGIEEPQLMKIVRATLNSHSEWFKLQMCKDRFEGLLRINSLKEVGSPLLSDVASKSNIDTCTHGSSEVTVSSVGMPEDGNSPTQMSSGDVAWDENAILKVMEFLALPRAEAIHLLSQYNGNAEMMKCVAVAKTLNLVFFDGVRNACNFVLVVSFPGYSLKPVTVVALPGLDPAKSKGSDNVVTINLVGLLVDNWILHE